MKYAYEKIKLLYQGVKKCISLSNTYVSRRRHIFEAIFHETKMIIVLDIGTIKILNLKGHFNEKISTKKPYRIYIIILSQSPIMNPQIIKKSLFP